VSGGNGWVLVDLKDFKSFVGYLAYPRWVRFPHIPVNVRGFSVNPGIVLLLSGVALLLLASSLLAADSTAVLNASPLPDTTSTMPISLVGVTGSFKLDEEPDLKHPPYKSVLLSTILPGLGQANNGRWVKASAFVVVGSLLVTRVIVESERADRYLYLSRSATSDAEAGIYYDAYSTHFDRRDRFIWWAVGFWIYNMLDAYIDGHLFGFSRQ
jgi:hypothetical protein